MPLDKLKKDLSIYSDLIDFNALFIEIDLFYKIKDSVKYFWQTSWTFESFEKALLLVFQITYFNYLINIYLTSPIANVTSEREFSCLKRVKTDLRSTMFQGRMSSLVILNFENEMLYLINIEEVIDEFSSKKNRRTIFHW